VYSWTLGRTKKMIEEYLFWDNQSFMKQIDLAHKLQEEILNDFFLMYKYQLDSLNSKM
jgi:hypothetical protein